MKTDNTIRADGFERSLEEDLKYLQKVFSAGKFQDVLDKGDVVVRRHLNSAALFNILGSAFLELGNTNDAKAQFQRALSVDPNFPKALYNMGILCQFENNLNGSLAWWRSLTKLEPAFVEGHNSMGHVLLELGNPTEALKCFQRTIEANNDDASAHKTIGDILRSTGDFDGAIKSYQKAVFISPDFAEAYNNLGIAQKKIGEVDLAIKNYKTAIKIDSNFLEAHNNLGNILTEIGEIKLAVNACQEAVFINSDCYEAQNNLGNALLELQDFDGALACYLKASELRPTFAAPIINSGLVMIQKGELNDAINFFQKAILIEPTNVTAYTNIGLTFIKLSDGEIYLENEENQPGSRCTSHNFFKQSAISFFQKALEIEPELPEVKHLLAAISNLTTSGAPKQYVEGLFDGYARQFEDSLTNLSYRIPDLLSAEILEQSNWKTGSTLDMGCGTGLSGLKLADYSERLVGVDLSKNMLRHAQAKNIYHELIHSELILYLNEKKLDFDTFIAMDVFVYHGDLRPVFEVIKRRNRRSGTLAFSTEHIDNGDYTLKKTGRYAHSGSYIKSLCKDYDYSLINFKKVRGRIDHGKDIESGLYLLTFEV